MTRLRLLLALAVLSLTLGTAGPAFAQETPTEGDVPAVVVSDESEAGGEEAWTFRYLVPTLLALTGVVMLVVVYSYGSRIKTRYRVTR